MEQIEQDENMMPLLKEIDDDHAELVDCYDKLTRLSLAEDGPSAVGFALQKLVDRTGEHFRSEESLMEQTGYPKLKDHQAEHEALMNSVSLYLQRGLENDYQNVLGHQSTFLRSWLVNHVLGSDKEFAQYFVRTRGGRRHLGRPGWLRSLLG